MRGFFICQFNDDVSNLRRAPSKNISADCCAAIQERGSRAPVSHARRSNVVQGEKDDEIATARGRWGFDARQPRNSGQRRSGGRWAEDDCRRNVGRRSGKLQALLAPAWPSRLPTRVP